jgi:hypothetical protein
MMRKNIPSAASVALALVAAGGTMAASDDDDHGQRRLRASLSSFHEVPTLSTAARGSFFAVLSEDEGEIKYRLDYSGLEGTVTQAHIHLGATHTNGSISVWLCGTASNPGPAGTPVCAALGGDGPEATGTLVATNVIGPAAQGIALGEFAELVKAIKAGVTYANVHTTLFPTGEIRGQIKFD